MNNALVVFTATYTNKDTYSGDFKNLKKNGKGVYSFNNSGAKYTGDFVDDKKQGSGTFIYPNESKYVGLYACLVVFVSVFLFVLLRAML